MRPRWIPLITMSRPACEKYIAEPATAVISIRSTGADLPDLRGFCSVYSMAFDDDQWHDWETRNNTITRKQADDLIEYIDLKLDDVQRLVIHCDAGISRSVSMALALAKLYSFRYDPGLRCRYDSEGRTIIPNPSVFIRICEAYARARASYNQ